MCNIIMTFGMSVKVLPKSFSCKAGKEKGNEVILLWMKAIRRHLYWCARSKKQGFGDLIVAKWKSIVRHISNKHDYHPFELYARCAHGETEPRAWIPVGKFTQLHSVPG